MPNTIQPRENSRGGGTDDALYIFTAMPMASCTFVTSTGTAAGGTGTTTGSTTTSTATTRPRCATHFISLPAPWLEEFCLTSWPYQPPAIRPISSSGTDKAIYFLLSSAFVSQRIESRIFRVSSLRIAARTNGIFSSRGRKAAVASISIVSTNRSSILRPKVCRWLAGRCWIPENQSK